MTNISTKVNDLMNEIINNGNDRHGEEMMDGVPGDLNYTVEERVCW